MFLDHVVIYRSKLIHFFKFDNFVYKFLLLLEKVVVVVVFLKYLIHIVFFVFFFVPD